MSSALEELDNIEFTTPEGRRMKEAVKRYLAEIRTKEQAFEELKRIGIFNEDGTPNPYFHPELAESKDE